MNVPRITRDLLRQLERVERSTDGSMEYRPCRVILKNDRTMDAVYVVDSSAYFKHWGVWPTDDPHKKSISIGDVATIEDSPVRISAALANKMYAAGESGMGYCVFSLVLQDGRKLPYVTGGAVDFVNLPEGVRREQIVDLLPHEGRETWGEGFCDRKPYRWERGADYSWCLYTM